MGGFRFRAPDALPRAATIIRAVIADARPNLIISGDCPYGGVDDLAEQLATEAGIPFKAYPATTRRWDGVGGYRERNLKIAGVCTRLLRIVCAYSTTYGSGWTRDRVADRLGWKYTRSYLIDLEETRLEQAPPPDAPRRGPR